MTSLKSARRSRSRRARSFSMISSRLLQRSNGSALSGRRSRGTGSLSQTAQVILGRLALLRRTIWFGPTPDRDTDAPQISQHSRKFRVHGRNDGKRGLWKAGEVPLQRANTSRFPVRPPWPTRSHQHVPKMWVTVNGNRRNGRGGQQPPQPVVFREKKELVRRSKGGQPRLLLQQPTTRVKRD